MQLDVHSARTDLLQSTPKCNGFFLGPRYTLLPIFIKVGWQKDKKYNNKSQQKQGSRWASEAFRCVSLHATAPGFKSLRHSSFLNTQGCPSIGWFISYSVWFLIRKHICFRILALEMVPWIVSISVAPELLAISTVRQAQHHHCQCHIIIEREKEEEIINCESLTQAH